MRIECAYFQFVVCAFSGFSRRWVDKVESDMLAAWVVEPLGL